MNSIEKTRFEISNLKKEVLLPIAKEKANKANESITETEKELASKNLNLENNDNLAISKESYNKSIDLIGKNRYYDSIQESEKAIELCSSTLRDKNLLAISKTKENKTEASSKEIKTKENQISSKFIKYIVTKKNPPETLWKIAADKKNLGDKHKWKKIYQANKKTISDPDKIYPNQVILIPRK
jgi:nucleoid-associated protein YgaU